MYDVMKIRKIKYFKEKKITNFVKTTGSGNLKMRIFQKLK